jgi:predicted amidohydrolase/dienelactone hydrolase/lysophospholipase L1-like esterase
MQTFSLLLLAAVPVQQSAVSPLPKVVLVGDSIRLGYAPNVARKLDGVAVVVSPKANAGNSATLLKNLDQWVIREKPDVVHFNCGLHDLKKSKKDGSYQVGIEEYERNLRAIVGRLRAETRATIVFALTTPIDEARHARRSEDFERLDADVRRYNDVARRVMLAAGMPIHDLDTIVRLAVPEQLLSPDGTHYTPAGYERLADAVADCVRRQLYVRNYKPLATPKSAPEATAAYQKAEAERDAQVPAAYKKLPVPAFQPPADARDWANRRPQVLKAVEDSLGDWPPRPAPPRARLVSRELRPGYALERVGLDDGLGGEISALLLIPDKREPKAAAILWLHSSTPDSNQLITPATNGGPESLGEVFVKKGYVVLAPDAAWYGGRGATGPSGPAEAGRLAQDPLHKLDLWFGRTLWGRFVRDDRIALDYLCSRPEVDVKRIGATGMSMGSTRSWWLAAVDNRIAATVGVACLTRYQNLIAHGQLRQHGIYYFAYGLLKHFDVEGVLSLIAPRPYLALTGDLDAGSPADGIRILEDVVRRTYVHLGAADRFRSVLYHGLGHTYTPEMRSEMLQWFDRWLRPVALPSDGNAEPAPAAKKRLMRVGGAQPRARTFDHRLTPAEALVLVDQNLAALEKLVAKAAEAGCDVLAFPEDTLGTLKWEAGNREAVNELLPAAVGRMLDRLGRAAATHHMYLVCCNDLTDEQGAIRNTAFFLGRDGHEIGRYHKVNLPIHEQSRTRGTSHPVFPTPDLGSVGMLICYDMVFPEAPRCLALAGADIIFHPTLGGAAVGDGDISRAAFRTRAVENFVYIVVSQRGNGSMIISPKGKILAEGHGPDDIAIADIDPFGGRDGGDAMNHQQDMRARLFRERSPAAYGILTDPDPPVLKKVPATIKVDDAVRIAEKVLTVGDARFREADDLRRAGNTEEAIRAFEKLRAEFPDSWLDRLARERLATLRDAGKTPADRK